MYIKTGFTIKNPVCCFENVYFYFTFDFTDFFYAVKQNIPLQEKRVAYKLNTLKNNWGLVDCRFWHFSCHQWIMPFFVIFEQFHCICKHEEYWDILFSSEWYQSTTLIVTAHNTNFYSLASHEAQDFNKTVIYLSFEDHTKMFASVISIVCLWMLDNIC